MKSLLLLTGEFPPYRGGIATYATELASAAASLGYDVQVYAPSFDWKRSSGEASYPFHVKYYRGGRPPFWRTPEVILRTWRQITGRRFDIVHAVDYPFMEALALIGAVRPTRFMATLHGSEILRAFTSMQGRVSRRAGVFEAPARLVTNSEYTKSLLLNRFPHIPAERVVPALLGVSPFWASEDPEVDARRLFRIEPSKKILLTVARLTPRKGHRQVLRALAALPDRLKDEIVYVIAGPAVDGAYASELHELAGKTGVSVEFAGVVTDQALRALYASAYLMCMPGEHDPRYVEGLGLVYLEAAAQGLPSIASRMGGIPEAVMDGRTGVLVETPEPAELARCIADLLEAPESRARMSREARNWSARFSWASCARRTYEGYTDA